MPLRVAASLRGWRQEENGLRDAVRVSKASRLRIAGKMPATPVTALSTMLGGRTHFLRRTPQADEAIYNPFT